MELGVFYPSVQASGGMPAQTAAVQQSLTGGVSASVSGNLGAGNMGTLLGPLALVALALILLHV